MQPDYLHSSDSPEVAPVHVGEITKVEMLIIRPLQRDVDNLQYLLV